MPHAVRVPEAARKVQVAPTPRRKRLARPAEVEPNRTQAASKKTQDRVAEVAPSLVQVAPKRKKSQGKAVEAEVNPAQVAPNSKFQQTDFIYKPLSTDLSLPPRNMAAGDLE